MEPSCCLLEMTVFLPRPANHGKPSDADGSHSGSLDAEPPYDVWSPNSRYGHLAGVAGAGWPFSARL